MLSINPSEHVPHLTTRHTQIPVPNYSSIKENNNVIYHLTPYTTFATLTYSPLSGCRDCTGLNMTFLKEPHIWSNERSLVTV